MLFCAIVKLINSTGNHRAIDNLLVCNGIHSQSIGILIENATVDNVVKGNANLTKTISTIRAKLYSLR